jgi:CheY-like chemotaxis protein
MSIAWPADPLRILLVVDDEQVARAVAASLGDEFAAGLRTCLHPEQSARQALSHRARLVVLALATIEASERIALALQGAGAVAGARPFLLVACHGAAVPHAARLCKDGVFDDYVQQLPAPADPDRLAASVRVAARIDAATPLRGEIAERTSAAPSHRPIVLVVEDDEVLHALLAAMLEPAHVDVVFEADGAAALGRIQAIGPDLVLMDVMLPGGNDGVELTGRIKAIPDLAAIPVLMMTGEARLDTLVRSMEAGAADFIVKPFTREALLAKVGKYLPAVA